MPKKFYDIIPPSSKKSIPSKKPFLAEQPSVEEVKGKKKKKRKPRKSRKVFFKSLIFSLLGLIVVVVLGFLFFSGIEIEIWPKTESLEFNCQVSLKNDLGGELGDWVESRTIPGQSFDVKKTKEKEFSSTGKKVKEAEAAGTIRVYNAHSTYSQSLLSSTRFVSSDGKLFKSLKKEVISGGKYEGGKFVSGYTDIEVKAAEPGEGYNIGPSTFSIPGFAGTAKYTTFYGKSFTDMTGGFKGEVAQVTQGDLDRAREDLVNKLKEENFQFLKDTLPEDYTLLFDTLSHEVLNTNSSKEAENEGESFNYQVELKSQGLSFNKKEMRSFVKEVIRSRISEKMEIQEESLNTDFSVESLDLEKGEVVLELDIRAKIFFKIDLEKVKKSISGQTLNEVKLFLGNLPGIEKIEVKSWLFWRRRFPDDIKEIELKLII